MQYCNCLKLVGCLVLGMKGGWINSPPFYRLNYRGVENFVVKNLVKFYRNRLVLNTPPLLGIGLDIAVGFLEVVKSR